jgi:putative selenate reductase
MAPFSPIPFEDLIRRLFHEYNQHGKILGMPREKFFHELPGVNLAVTYMGRKASTPFGPAAGPHTQLAQNLVLAWLAGARIMELKTVQILDQIEIARPCIDTSTIGFNVEWSQELSLEASQREYVKAWMLLEIIKQAELLGEEFSQHHCETVFDLSLGYDFKGIKSPAMHDYIQGLKQAERTIASLRQEIPPEFSRFKDFTYNPQIIDTVTLSTFHGCPADQIDHIVSHLLTEHQVNVIVKFNPTLLGQEEVEHLLYDELGYHDLQLKPDAFAQDLQFAQAVELIRSMTHTADSLGKSIGVKFTNTLLVHNHREYFSDDEMYVSGPPLHLIALRLLEKFHDALGPLRHRLPISFSAGVDEANFADVASLNLVPVTVCTDMLKVPGSEKGAAYLQHLGDQMEAVGAINMTDYRMKRFDHAVAAIEDVFAMLLAEVRQTVQQTPEPERDVTTQVQLQIFNALHDRVLNAFQENSNSLELLTTDALIITDTLKTYAQRFGASADFPRSFTQLYDRIIAATARKNLTSLLDQTRQNPRYTSAKNSRMPRKLPLELTLHDCTSCGRCLAVCPNNANFVYHVQPGSTPYHNYTLTADGVTESEGGVFTLEKFYQIANFDDCCNECGLCEQHCVETGYPAQAKPKYFGSRQRWQERPDLDGFWVEVADGRQEIAGRIGGQEYTLIFDCQADRITFSDGTVEAVFAFPDHTLVTANALSAQPPLGHVLDVHAYHVLFTQLQGVLNRDNCNYVNVKYQYECQKQPVNLRGIIAVLNTPFSEQNQVDLSALRKHVRLALDEGVVGFLTPAMAGEVDKLTDAERQSIVETVLDEVKQQASVIGCASAATQAERLKHVEYLLKAGCDGVLVRIPYRNDQQYAREVREIANLNPDLLMLQDWDATGYGIPVPLIKQLFYEIEAFRCLKIEVVPAGVKYTQVLEATGGALHVSGGWGVTQMIEALDRGVHAFMPTGMYAIYTHIYRLYQAGQRVEARELFYKLLPVLAFSNQHLDISIHFFKRLLYRQGVYTSPNVRAPITPFDRHHAALADELIERVHNLLVSLQ